MMDLKPPYWACDSSDYPFPDHHFNREILKPDGDRKIFPGGAIGVRVDEDFWTVAALPFKKYQNVEIKDIVAEFWPDITDATFGPDSIEE